MCESTMDWFLKFESISLGQKSLPLVIVNMLLMSKDIYVHVIHTFPFNLIIFFFIFIIFFSLIFLSSVHMYIYMKRVAMLPGQRNPFKLHLVQPINVINKLRRRSAATSNHESYGALSPRYSFGACNVRQQRDAARSNRVALNIIFVWPYAAIMTSNHGHGIYMDLSVMYHNYI